jgi:hypothetical protein
MFEPADASKILHIFFGKNCRLRCTLFALYFTSSFVSHESFSFLSKIPETFVLARSFIHFSLIFSVLLLVALDFPFRHYPQC